jgi:ABC-type multidrug transport system ATPase subunit
MQLEFSSNWNNKLFCTCFTTIRASSKYQTPEPVEVFLNGKKLYDAQLLRWERRYAYSEYESHLDTSYTARDTHDIINKMYGKILKDSYYYLYKRIKSTETKAYFDLIKAHLPTPTLFDQA